MDSYILGHKIITDEDLKNTSVGTNLAYSKFESNDGHSYSGNTKKVIISSPKEANWNYIVIPLNASFRKGESVTISLDATFTGEQSTSQLFKATIYPKNPDIPFEDGAGDNTPLSINGRSKKTMIINHDSDPNNPPCLYLYSGVAGKTGGNTLIAKNIKVERGTVATQYSLSPLDVAMKSDVDELRQQIQALKSKMGG